MILVADSGSTKSDWILRGKDQSSMEAKTMGFNPFFHSSSLVQQKVSENEVLSQHAKSIEEVYFYGAGCSSPERNLIIQKGLQNVFTKAHTVLVDHDLTGASRATADRDPGITCILGTGSNSCYFDGKDIIEEISALGYILGDEGSGSYFGKILLADYLYKRMPEDLAKGFEELYKLSKESIFENVYNKENVNVYLASFMRFASPHKDHPYIKEMVYAGLSKFISTHVWCYPNFREVPVHFIGSIAYYFTSILEELALNHRFTVGKIIKKPVIHLAEYHFNKKFSTGNNEFESVHI